MFYTVIHFIDTFNLFLHQAFKDNMIFINFQNRDSLNLRRENCKNEYFKFRNLKNKFSSKKQKIEGSTSITMPGLNGTDQQTGQFLNSQLVSESSVKTPVWLPEFLGCYTLKWDTGCNV